MSRKLRPQVLHQLRREKQPPAPVPAPPKGSSLVSRLPVVSARSRSWLLSLLVLLLVLALLWLVWTWVGPGRRRLLDLVAPPPYVPEAPAPPPTYRPAPAPPPPSRPTPPPSPPGAFNTR